jgi:dTDP-4-dehydrorhamnose 3,5-epimerase
VRFLETDLPGVVIVEPDVHQDGRGYFLETFHHEKYRAAGIVGPFVQDNESRSAKGTLRGLHMQNRRPQGKLIRVIEGEIWDVAVDARPQSPTFGRWSAVTLSAANFKQCYIPTGFAHGFCVMSAVALVEYKCTDIPAARSVSRGTTRRSTSIGRSKTQFCRSAMGGCRRLPPRWISCGRICNRPTKVVSAHAAKAPISATFLRIPQGTRLAPGASTIAGVITAGRRECWGSHTDGAEGHRNHAMPFCFVPDRFSR